MADTPAIDTRATANGTPKIVTVPGAGIPAQVLYLRNGGGLIINRHPKREHVDNLNPAVADIGPGVLLLAFPPEQARNVAAAFGLKLDG